MTTTQLTAASASPLHLDDGGAGGTPVVLLHSAGGNVGQLAGLLARVRPGRRALALDLRGHGRSALPAAGGFGPQVMAADVLAVLDRLGIDRAVISGHSMGGAVAVACLGLAPERFAGAFLLDPSSDGRAIPFEAAAGFLSALRSPAYAETVEGFWAPMLAPSTREVRERVLADLRATAAEAVTGSLEGLLSFDPVTPLQAFRGPVRSLVTSFNDVPGALHVLVPRIEHERVEGVGHWLQLDAPDRVAGALERFLARFP